MKKEPSEMSDIENIKENILPLKEGRSASSLCVKTSELNGNNSNVAIEAFLNRQKEYQTQIAQADELDDPLAVHFEYINWLLENSISGHNALSDYIPALESATNKFCKDARWKNDPRYLKCWYLYAKVTQDPNDVFVFLIQNQIGLELASFYEEYSEFLEFGDKKIIDADIVFKKGIERNAQPILRLKRKYSEFLNRNSEILKSVPVANNSPIKSSLIFCDNSSRETLFEERLSNNMISNPWTALANEQKRHKENAPNVSSWTGQVMKSVVPVTNVEQAKFKIYTDVKAYNCLFIIF